jgi:peptide/nickel transport system permease protein
MLKYLIKRIFIFIPTLIIITLLGFVISVNAPGDPVERMVTAAQSGGEIGSQSVSQIEQKMFWRRKLGLDLPVFYFSLNSSAQPDTLYKIVDKTDREALGRLINKYGNWQAIQSYYKALDHLHAAHFGLTADSLLYAAKEREKISETLNQSKFESLSLRASYDDKIILMRIENSRKLYGAHPFFKPLKNYLEQAEHKYSLLKATATPWKNYIPKIAFYKNNQYHRWVFGDGNWLTGKGSEFSKGLLRGDFGTSYVTKQPISEVIGSKIGWSLFFSLGSVLIAYLVSIPLGINAAANKGSRFDKWSTMGLFILYSMPSFWVATILLMTFANPDVLAIFPASGVKPAGGYPDAAGFFEKLKITIPYLILPLICYTYSSFAFLSRTMRVSMLEVIGQDYIRTARAKGLAEKTVIWKHALRNSLLPIITVFANIFPYAIGGSVILETIFTIPGMGSESIFAIQNQNYPMIIAVLTITGILTLVGYLVSDILYVMADPRITYSK